MHHASVLSHTQLKAYMAAKEQKRGELEELMDQEAAESKNHLLTLESNIQDKARRQQESCQKTKAKCHLQFARQADRWELACQNNEDRTGAAAKRVIDKFTKTNTQCKQKENDQRDKIIYLTKNKKEHLDDVGGRLKAEADRLNNVDKKTVNRAKNKEKLRESILAEHSLDRLKKAESIRLKHNDVNEN